MELRHLRYFVAVADEQNISRAAARLHVSQPPLTRQIKQLEEELETQLFERSSRGVTLTDAGRVFLADARRLLEQVDIASHRARRAASGELGRIDVALFGTGIYGAIPHLLRAHRFELPDVEVVLHNMTKQEQLDALARGSIDLAFNRLMRPVPGLVSEVLMTEPLLVAAPEEHPVAQQPATELSALRDLPMVLFPTGYRPSFIDRVRDMCLAVGFEPDVRAEVADVVHGIAMVATGGAFCLVPHSATNVRIPGVSYVPLADRPRLEVDLCCIYRSDDEAPVLQRLLSSMRRAAPGVMARTRLEVHPTQGRR